MMSTVAGASPSVTSQSLKTNKRIQLESLIREFQTKLGNNWEKYHESLSLFLVGKLSRVELVEAVRPFLGNGLVEYHNKLLLLNFANSLEDSPVEFSSELASFWNKRNSKAKSVKSSQYEKFKQNIMGLPLKERRRIRSITRDAGKKDKINAYITLTRQALLPKIPMIQDKEQQQLQVSNLVKWQQDVVNGINTPLSSTSHELPDLDNLSRKVLMTMRENGLTGGINQRVLEVISLGLETHLKNIIESSIDIVRYRRRKYESSAYLNTGFLGNDSQSITDTHNTGNSNNSPSRKRKLADTNNQKRDIIISIEDIYNSLEMFPYLIEPCGPNIRLANVMLENDDQIDHSSYGYTLPTKPKSLAGDASSNPVSSVANGNINNDKIQASNESSTESKDKHMNGGIGSGINSKSTPENPVRLQKDQSHIGTTDELKWVLHDLITST